MSELINVRISCSERVYYDKTVSMKPEEWTAFKNTPSRQMECSSTSPINDWVDPSEVVRSGGFDDIEAVVVGDDYQTPMQPEDCYEG